MPIKTFRGLIANDTEDTILLHTIDGSIGYRIKKFELIGIHENIDYETTVQVFKVSQAAAGPSASIDFNDNTLLAAGLYGDSTSGTARPSQIVVFDQEIFNQDIYVTHKASSGSTAMNYYLELEQIKLDVNESTMATLKDIRNVAQ